MYITYELGRIVKIRRRKAKLLYIQLKYIVESLDRNFLRKSSSDYSQFEQWQNGNCKCASMKLETHGNKQQPSLGIV